MIRLDHATDFPDDVALLFLMSVNMRVNSGLGAILKGRPHPRGEGGGGSQKRTHADAGGRGGQWQNADVLEIQIFTKIF